MLQDNVKAEESNIDRSGVQVPVPAPVVPYVPPTATMVPSFTSNDLTHTGNSEPSSNILPVARPPPNPSSADFSSFETNKQRGNQASDSEDDYDSGYTERDRIDVQTPLAIDPHSLVYSQKSAPYGQQFPSYVPESIHTMVGTLGTGSSTKTFSTDDSVVYGKFPEGAHAAKDLNMGLPEIEEEEDYYYYDDNFEYAPGEYYYDDENDNPDYYDEEKLQVLKKRLGMSPRMDEEKEESDDKKVSFAQLLKNLQGNAKS